MIMSLFMLLSCMCILTFLINNKYLLMALLSLESIIISFLFPIIMFSSLINPMEPSLIMITLSFAACEASLGLASLVAMSRCYGNDYMNLLSLTKC